MLAIGPLVSANAVQEGHATLQSSLEHDVDGLDIQTLRPGTVVVVETENSHYRFLVLMASMVLVRGGTIFPDDTAVRLAGATLGGSAIKPGWIVIGWRIELGLGSVAVRSSSVRSVKVESARPSMWRATFPDSMN